MTGSDGFVTTRWSLVSLAGRGVDAEQRRAALESLCSAYWPPLHAYVRRRVASEDEARDLTQGFFAHILERGDLATTRRDRGRFRAWLLTALKHFLINEWEAARAQKRGGGRPAVSLDFDEHDSHAGPEPADDVTPEQLYERAWAVTLLDAVLAALRAEVVEDGDARQRETRAARFDALLPHLAGEAPHGSQAATATELGTTVGALRSELTRLRRRYRERLRQEVAQTVIDPADVDDELAGLFAALRPPPPIV